MPLLDIVAILCAALIGSFAALFWITSRADRQTGLVDPDQVFLFEGNLLFHASEAARVSVGEEDQDFYWEELRDQLITRFPTFPSKPPETALTIPAGSEGATGCVVLSPHGGKTRVEIHENYAGEVAIERVDQQELDILRRVNACAQNPTWVSDADGKITWKNPAFEKLIAEVSPTFEDLDFGTDESLSDRVMVPGSVDRPSHWYEVRKTSDQGTTVREAVQIDAVVRAEEAQRNFVQTLAKTFAHLSTGLAIFDRNRQLVLFNPALVDLTSLPAEFLSSRPTLISFFDRLRDTRAMPEPKNYVNWRQEIAKVIAEADNGSYEEVWTLETGQTYRVTGRPHPDGATAFLVEDISAEVSLTRNYRAELQLSECLLDSVDDALVVFSRSGALTFSNAAFRDLWNIDADTSFAEFTIGDATRVWAQSCGSEMEWQSVEDFVLGRRSREDFQVPVYTHTGATLMCSIQPVVSGATLIRFSQIAHRDVTPTETSPTADHVA